MDDCERWIRKEDVLSLSSTILELEHTRETEKASFPTPGLRVEIVNEDLPNADTESKLIFSSPATIVDDSVGKNS
jgi:hypothetical protein